MTARILSIAGRVKAQSAPAVQELRDATLVLRAIAGRDDGVIDPGNDQT